MLAQTTAATAAASSTDALAASVRENLTSALSERPDQPFPRAEVLAVICCAAR
jgi:hypothetical protein